MGKSGHEDTSIRYSLYEGGVSCSFAMGTSQPAFSRSTHELTIDFHEVNRPGLRR